MIKLIDQERIALRDELLEVIRTLSFVYMSNKNTYVINKNKLEDYLSKNLEFQQKHNLYISQFRSKEEATYCLIHNDDFINHICPICGNICKFYNINRGYRETCADKKCRDRLISKIVSSDESNNKRIQTNLKNLGVEWPSQSPEVQAKIIKSVQEHYNVENVSQSEEIKAKKVQTSLEHWGTESPMQCEEIQNKLKNVFLDKYNVENPFQAEECKEKARQTTLKQCGSNYYLQQNIAHYDIWNNDELFKQYIIDRYNEESFLTLRNISYFFNIHPNTLRLKIGQLNLVEYFYIPESNLEINFKIFLESYNILYKRRDQTVLYNDQTKTRKEIDFLINNIGIEINDITTHNSKCKDPLYHQQKSLLAVEKGIRLIHLWEWELRNEPIWFKLSKWLLNELNYNKYFIDSKQCNLMYINKDTEQQFYNLYSIKEYQDSDVCIGIIYNNQLYQIMSFKNIDNQWYLINYGTVYNYNINDGYNIILDSFINSQNINSLISYCYLDKDDIDLYHQLKFTLQEITHPNITYCNKHMNTSKTKLQGYVPIYDCGIGIFYFNK